MMVLRTCAAAAALACLLPLAQTASAHASLEIKEAPSGAFYKAVVKVPHGCQGSPTNVVKITVPDGLVGAKPMPKAGWTLATVKGAYGAPMKGYNGKLATEGVVEIVWSGGRLLDEHYDEFVFQALVSESVAPGTTIPVKVTQLCESGEVAWVELAATGSDHKLAYPAPLLKVTAGAGNPSSAAVEKASGIAVERPWTRATPAGAPNAGAFLRIVNRGKQSDRLIAVQLDGGAKTEIHETTTVEGVMRMRRMEAIEIPAGAVIELKPGGLHIMIMGLEKPIETGSAVKGVLVFEKAGRIEVDFPAAPVGASAPAAAEGHGHH